MEKRPNVSNTQKNHEYNIIPREELLSIIETTPDIIFRLDPHGKISFINNAVKKYRYSPEDLIDQDIFNLIHPEDRKKATHRINERRTGDRSTQKMEIRLLVNGDEGNANIFLIDAKGLYDQHRRFIGSQGVARDITDRKKNQLAYLKLKDKFHQTQKLESLAILAGGIAHDFNNMLMGILGNTDMALLDLPATSPVLNNIRQIQKITQRAADLTHQMLTYSGKCRFSIQPIDINKIINDIRHLLQVTITNHIVLNCNLDEHIPRFEADISQIRQIIMNLIINSTEAIGKNTGEITISTGKMRCDREYLESPWTDEEPVEGLYVYLEVSDTGCGMKEEEIEKIFDPFFTTKFIGRGLGLSEVHGITRSHNGRIKIDSKPNQGTTFRILFPANSNAVSTREESEIKDHIDVDNETILFVDDEESIRFIGQQMLERAGFNVITAEDGNHAIDLFKTHAKEISCILLDLAMPHMSGEETLRQLRLIQKDVPIIISTGYDEQEVNMRFPGNIISGFIQKPYQYKKLIGKVYKVLKQDDRF